MIEGYELLLAIIRECHAKVKWAITKLSQDEISINIQFLIEKPGNL